MNKEFKHNTLWDEIDFLIKDSGIKTKFSHENIQSLEQLNNKSSQEEQNKRVDLTQIPFCTIDSNTAKDLDDAVYAFEKDGNFHVMIAIADVTHFVEENSPADLDAFQKSSSIYFPGNCIPMLPAKLSNELCSLEPHAPKLSINISFVVTLSGEVKDISLFKATICSKAKLTYSQVQDLFDSNFNCNKDEIPNMVIESIKALRKVSLILRNTYLKRGLISFETFEPKIILNHKGEPLALISMKTAESHRLIENLMITTNEAVATFFNKKNIDTLYRIHEPPSEQKIYFFIEKFNNFEFKKLIKKRLSEEVIENNKLFAKFYFYAKKYFNKIIPENVFLQCMSRAYYSSNNIGHYGLASECYLHFTSPIRRYPDLLAHRILKEFWNKQYKNRNLKEIADYCSNQERKIVSLERKIQFRFILQLMKKKIEEYCIGIVVSKMHYGIFVRLKIYQIDGLISASELPPFLMREFNIGDNVLIQIAGFNPFKQCLKFKFISKQ